MGKEFLDLIYYQQIMQEQFEKVIKEIDDSKGSGKENPMSNDEKLLMYGWFKQAKVGDINTERPSGFSNSMNFEGKAKWDAWKACEGMSKEDAMTKYVAKYNEYK